MNTSWNLEYFFRSEEEFLKTLDEFKTYIPKVAEFAGKLGEEESLIALLKLQKEAEALLVRLYHFASMRSDQDKKNADNAADLTKVQLALQDYYANLSYFEPELISLGKEKADAFLEKHPEFDEYSFIIEKLFRGQSHVLTSDKEALLSAFGPIRGEAGKLYSTLTVADLTPAEATLSDGSKVLVTQANWSTLIAKTKNPEDRQAIFEALYGYYEKHKVTYGEIYSFGLQNQLATVKTRGYKDILEAHLYDNAIPEGVFHTLVKVASEGAEPLKKYYRVRAKALGLAKHRSYDRFLHLAESEKDDLLGLANRAYAHRERLGWNFVLLALEEETRIVLDR